MKSVEKVNLTSISTCGDVAGGGAIVEALRGLVIVLNSEESNEPCGTSNPTSTLSSVSKPKILAIKRSTSGDLRG